MELRAGLAGYPKAASRAQDATFGQAALTRCPSFAGLQSKKVEFSRSLNFQLRRGDGEICDGIRRSLVLCALLLIEWQCLEHWKNYPTLKTISLW
ncbi:Testis-Expressed Protein 9 [Manis pentadactyla]|nr:Testis-Expressed Protein 9 [Manis pentadactyla]